MAMQTIDAQFNGYYEPTAYDGSCLQKEAPADNGKFGAITRKLRSNMLPGHPTAQCREFISRPDEASCLRQLQSNSREIKEAIEMPFHEFVYWTTLRNPKAMLRAIIGVIGILSLFFWVGGVVFGIIFTFIRPGWFFTSQFISFGISVSLPTPFYLFGKLLLKSSIIKDKNNIKFNRRTGMVSIPGKNPDILDVPFNEFDGYLETTVNPSGRTCYHFVLGHRNSVTRLPQPGDSDNSDSVDIEWEFLKTYMNVSCPLPDIPSMEPFRLRDPVTAEHDRRLNRPERFWRDMDPETFKKMHDASYKAAKEYPWGMTHKEAIASGWQPSPFNEDNLKALYRKSDIESVL